MPCSGSEPLIPVFRIRDVLIWIKIRGSEYHWITDSELISLVAFKMPKRNKFITFFYCLFLMCCRYAYIYNVYYTSVFRDNKLLRRSHKTVEIKGFLILLRVDGRIRIRTNIYGSGTGRPKNSQIRKKMLDTYL